MAVYASTAKVNGKALLDIIGTDALTKEQWTEMLGQFAAQACRVKSGKGCNL